MHCQQFDCKSEHGEIGKGNGELVQDKKKNGRVDKDGLAQQNLQGHKQGGPTWRDVACRVTADARSEDVINIEEATNINRDEEHRLVEVGPRDLVTVLLLKSVGVQNDNKETRGEL